METSPINVELLLAPLTLGEQGAGVDLRNDFSSTSPYQRLRDARAAARAAERERDAGKSDGREAAGWRDILSIGHTVLATQSKDLEVAAWLTEALVRIYGLQGLTIGAQLVKGLCEKYWEGLFPLPDADDGLDLRARPVGGLSGSSADGSIMQPLRTLVLFRRVDGTGVGLYHWEKAEKVSLLPEENREARYAAGDAKLEDLDKEARLDEAFLVGIGQQVVAAIAAWRAMAEVLDTCFGSWQGEPRVDPPSTTKVDAVLNRIQEVIGRLGGIVPVEAAVQAHATSSTSTPGVAPSPVQVATSTGTVTRDGALRELERIADYFRRSEPHSPLAYTLEEAVRRGKMSLAELLAEVLPDDNSRNGMMQRLGMRLSPPAKQD